MDVERVGDGAPLDVANTLATLDQIPGPRLITGVPEAAGGPYAALTVAVSEPRAVELDPYPFSDPEFELVITTREIEDRRYTGPDEATAAYNAAPVRELGVTVKRRR